MNYFLSLVLNFFLISSANLYAKDSQVTQLTKTDLNSLPSYILGPGDKLRIKVFKMSDFDSNLEILPDGTINLPRYGSLSVLGLSLFEAKAEILKAYKTILKRPVVYLDIISFRPISILITGEVQNPGLYSMGLKRDNIIQGSIGEPSLKLETLGWPTIVDAIQIAGGVTTNANLRNITLKRKQIPNQASSSTKINLWDLIKDGQIYNNKYIYSGDSIHISKAKKIKEFEKKLISNSNLSSSTILVNVVGEVFKPGFQKIKANSQPINALLSAGGINQFANGNKIKLLRIKDDGSVISKSFNYNKIINPKEKDNFILLDKDVLIVPSSKWAKTKRNILDLTEPIIRGSQIYSIFD